MSEPADKTTAPDPAAPTASAYADDLFCPDCGYSLRGLTSERCPECGLKLDFIESEVSLIPWERRREIGRLRAYWQTVLLVMFRNKVFCRAAYRPVGYHDARSFRWVSILHAYGPALLCLGVLHLLHPDLLPGAADEYGWWLIGLNWVCVLLALLAFTGMPSYFFHPRSLPMARQNRAVALSYYGCAPLALGPVMLLGFIIGAAVWGTGKHEYLTGLIAALVQVSILIWCWELWSRLAQRAFIGSGRRLLMTWSLPVLWLLVGGLILVGLPAIAYFLAIVFYGLRPVSLVG
ncbi:MAG: hypothetical protein KKI02_05755 [Planctomycetes bacterium]|nr:hypothetical protein [Planctomycetota bacterium]